MSTRSHSKTIAPSNSSVTAIASRKPVGTSESGSTKKDGQLSQDGRFRWSAGWGIWCPIGKGDDNELPGPVEWGPLMPERPHAQGCWCVECWNAGVRYSDYLKAKAVRERNGF